MNKLKTITVVTLLLMPQVTPFAAEPGNKTTDLLPRQGLVLWLNAENAVVEKGNVIKIKDRSDNGNDAVLEKDPKIVPGNPGVVKHEASGQPVLRFTGSFTGYAFNAITNARTVFMVVSKHPDAFKKFSERFVLGGMTKKETDYHVGYHWTDVITEGQFNRHGKIWFNGFPCDAGVSEFSSKLAVICFVAGRNTTVSQLARDRDFKDRSWYGDIGEIMIYDAPLTDADRQAVEGFLLNKYSITPFMPVVVSRESVLPGHVKPPAAQTK